MGKSQYLIFADIEFENGSPSKGSIIELGAIAVRRSDLEVMSYFHKFAKPDTYKHWNQYAEDKIHRLSRAFLEDYGLTQRELAVSFLHFLVPYKDPNNRPQALVYHAANPIEFKFLRELYSRQNLESSFNKVFSADCQENTLDMFNKLIHQKKGDGPSGLKHMTEYFGVSLNNHHRAIEDVKATYECYKRMVNHGKEEDRPQA